MPSRARSLPPRRRARKRHRFTGRSRGTGQRHSGQFLVAERNGKIVGSVVGGWDGWRGHIYRLVVDPAERRGGLGRRLVEEAERALVALGARRLSITVAGKRRSRDRFLAGDGIERLAARRARHPFHENAAIAAENEDADTSRTDACRLGREPATGADRLWRGSLVTRTPGRALESATVSRRTSSPCPWSWSPCPWRSSPCRPRSSSSRSTSRRPCRSSSRPPAGCRRPCRPSSSRRARSRSCRSRSP